MRAGCMGMWRALGVPSLANEPMGYQEYLDRFKAVLKGVPVYGLADRCLHEDPLHLMDVLEREVAHWLQSA